VWRECPDEDHYGTRWLTGLWSTQAKVEGMLKAAWHWCSHSSVLNYLLGEPGLPPTRGSVDSDRIFSLRILLEGSVTGDSDRYE
jgi:hypothetical protein